jgi:hypothetical protein
MLPTTNLKDPIKSIIYKRDFDWRFVRQNPYKVRPVGTEVFIASILLISDFSSRIAVIESEGKHHLICQLEIMLIQEDNFRNRRRLQNYTRMMFRNGYNLRDLNNPAFNIEWQFPIAHDGWHSIVEEMKKIQIPLMPIQKKNCDVRRMIWLKDNIDMISLYWSGDELRFDTLNKFINTLLNYCLIKVNTAYLIPKWE